MYQRLRPLRHPSLLNFNCKSGVYGVTMTFCKIVFGLPTWTICNFELIDLRVNYIPHWKALSSVRGQSKTMSLLAWTCKRLLKKMAAKYHHIFDTFKHFWVARMQNFFDPSMAIGGTAISFFLNLNFGPKIFLRNNIVKKIDCTHFWNYVLSKRLVKIAKKWKLRLC